MVLSQADASPATSSSRFRSAVDLAFEVLLPLAGRFQFLLDDLLAVGVQVRAVRVSSASAVDVAVPDAAA